MQEKIGELTHFEKRFIAWCEKKFDYQHRAHLVNVDFDKPWWDVFWQQKWLVVIQFFNLITVNMVGTVLPLVLSWIISQRNLTNLWYLLVFVFVYRVFAHILFYADSLLRLQTQTSLTASANKRLLLVDPISHSTRSSGQIISKINRLGTSYYKIIEVFTFEILSIVGALIVTVGSFWLVSWVYGLVSLVGILITIGFNVSALVWKTNMMEKYVIQFEDVSQAVNIQAMQQAPFIRSVFATPEMFDQIDTTNFTSLWKRGSSWRMSAFVISATQYIFYVSLGILGYLLISDKNVDVIISAAIMFTYFNLGQRVYFIGFTVTSLLESWIGIHDSFDFIRNYGKSSYPVLEE